MIQLLAFGSLELRDNLGHRLQAIMAQPKRAALLTYLALARPRGLHRRDHLTGLFWTELDDLHARRALNQALSYLRRELGEGTIVVRGPDELGVDPELISCDVIAFEEAVERGARGAALDLYRGELLAGLHAADAAEFTDWVDRERDRLRRLAAQCAYEHAAEERALGRVDSALAAARRALELNPFDEPVLRRVIRLQDEAGDRAGAIHTYESFRIRLSEQLETDPSPETQALVKVIRERTETTGVKRSTEPNAALRTMTVGPPVSVTASVIKAKPTRRSRWIGVAGVLLALTAAGAVWGAKWSREPLPQLAARTVSPKAKIAYLLGMEQYYKGGARLYDSAVSRFQGALASDSTFAPAWAALGLVHAYAIDYAILPVREACARARPAIQRALQLDPDLALAHVAHARILQHCDWNWKHAEEEYRKAIALEPSAMAYQSYGWLLEWYLGRAEEGVAMGERSVALDPGSALMHMALAWRLRGAGEIDRAEEEALLSLALDSTMADGHFILAEVYLRRGDYSSATREALRVRALGGSPAGWTTLGEIYARTGRVSDARAYMKLLQQQKPMTGPSRVALARTQMALGERDAALTTLERAVHDRIFIIPHQPYWDPIRNEPRFQAMMRAMRL